MQIYKAYKITKLSQKKGRCLTSEVYTTAFGDPQPTIVLGTASQQRLQTLPNASSKAWVLDSS